MKKITNLFRESRLRRSRRRWAAQIDYYRHVKPHPSPHQPDLEKLAIERLAGVDTEFGAALAMEIQRCLARREGRLP